MMSVSGKTTARAAGCRHLACAPALRPAPVRRPRISVQAAGASGNGNGNGNAAGKVRGWGAEAVCTNLVSEEVAGSSLRHPAATSRASSVPYAYPQSCTECCGSQLGA